VACAVEHSHTKELFGAIDEEERPVTRRAVQTFEGFNLSLSCRHCEDAPCIDACITGALTQDQQGAVICDTTKCVGCWMCTMVCRFGLLAPTLIVAKCDYCPDRERLTGKARYACVEACPTDALFVGAYEGFREFLRQPVAAKFEFGKSVAKRGAKP
jgi:carbon-monoxide dehydrogenase iron sulfur subunit